MYLIYKYIYYREKCNQIMLNYSFRNNTMATINNNINTTVIIQQNNNSNRYIYVRVYVCKSVNILSRFTLN